MTHEYDKDYQVYKVIFMTTIEDVTAPITYEVVATSPKDAIQKSAHAYQQWVNQGYSWDVMQ